MIHKNTRRRFGLDYRAPAFYRITIIAHKRRPRFAICRENRGELTEDGTCARDLWRRISVDYPGIETGTLCIMPDHLHGIVRAREAQPRHIGVAIRAFKAQVTSALRKKYANPGLLLWEKGYDDKYAWRDGALAAYTHYIKDNPRRYCLKKANPALFRATANLRHPALLATPHS
jgi:REP element-mobilizing transposase RayT